MKSIGGSPDQKAKWEMERDILAKSGQEKFAQQSKDIFRSINVANESGDCDAEALLLFTGSGFSSIVEFISAQVSIFEEEVTTGFSHRRPDMIARRELQSVVSTRWISDAYDDIESTQITIVKSLGVVATIGGSSLTVALENVWIAYAVLSVELIDAGYTLYDNYQGYQKDQKSLEFAEGASVLLGQRYLDSVRKNTSSAGARALDSLGALAGAGISGFDAFTINKAAAKALKTSQELAAVGKSTIGNAEFDAISEALSNTDDYQNLFKLIEDPQGGETLAKFLAVKSTDISKNLDGIGPSKVKAMQADLQRLLSDAKSWRGGAATKNLSATGKSAPDILDGANAYGEEIDAVEFKIPTIEIPDMKPVTPLRN